MTLFNAGHVFPLSAVTLNLLNNLIQVTFIEYLLYASQCVGSECTNGITQRPRPSGVHGLEAEIGT